MEHRLIGTVFGGIVTVPGVPGPTVAYGQMVAWDGRLWGTLRAAVPEDQLGRTEVVGAPLADILLPATAPYFTGPAIVPIPEPSVVALAAGGH